MFPSKIFFSIIFLGTRPDHTDKSWLIEQNFKNKSKYKMCGYRIVFVSPRLSIMLGAVMTDMLHVIQVDIRKPEKTP